MNFKDKGLRRLLDIKQGEGNYPDGAEYLYLGENSPVSHAHNRMDRIERDIRALMNHLNLERVHQNTVQKRSKKNKKGLSECDYALSSAKGCC